MTMFLSKGFSEHPLIEIEDYTLVQGEVTNNQWGGDIIGGFGSEEVLIYDMNVIGPADGIDLTYASPRTDVKLEFYLYDTQPSNKIGETNGSFGTGGWGNFETHSFTFDRSISGYLTLLIVGKKIGAGEVGQIAKLDDFRLTDSGDQGNSEPQINLPDELIESSEFVLKKAFANDLKFKHPVGIASTPISKRLFVVERPGTIYEVQNYNTEEASKSLFFRIQDHAEGDVSGPIDIHPNGAGHEAGLLGLVFHPEFETNRRFFVSYSYNFSQMRVSSFTIEPDGSFSDEEILIRQTGRGRIHWGGSLHFGQDGYLYISIGDGGDVVNATRVDQGFYGGIMRIDVDLGGQNAGHYPNPNQGDIARRSYEIPQDNPLLISPINSYLGRSINQNYLRTEFWAFGIRNPWRMSFSEENGQEVLWFGEIGESFSEEINRVTTGGKHYGWPYIEGDGGRPNYLLQFNENELYNNIPGDYIIAPALEDLRDGNMAIIGGVVPKNGGSLDGKYLYGDHRRMFVRALEPKEDGGYLNIDVVNNIPVTSFALDPEDGSVLLTQYNTDEPTSIMRIVEERSSASDLPIKLSETNAFIETSTLSPQPNVHHYDINVPFWSDHAIKSRYFHVPQGRKIEFHTDDKWSFPVGSVFVKHFEYERVPGYPDTQFRLETRFLKRTAQGIYGISYRWHEDGTATLVPPEGETISMELDLDGDGFNETNRDWKIPSRGECLQCHNESSGFVLGMDTRQMNLEKESFLGQFYVNQIEALRDQDYLDTTNLPSSLPVHAKLNDAFAPTLDKVRSYLDVNCAYCHHAEGRGAGNWDGSAHLSLSDMNLIETPVTVIRGDISPDETYIQPGDLNLSNIYRRINREAGDLIMPPLATTIKDEAAVDLIAQWISELGGPPESEFSFSSPGRTLNNWSPHALTLDSSVPENGVIKVNIINQSVDWVNFISANWFGDDLSEYVGGTMSLEIKGNPISTWGRINCFLKDGGSQPENIHLEGVRLNQLNGDWKQFVIDIPNGVDLSDIRGLVFGFAPYPESEVIEIKNIQLYKP